MLVLKGIYKEGGVQLLEPLPMKVIEPQEVIVTFNGLPSKQETHHPATKAALSLIGLLDDLTPEQIAEFDGALERREPFFGPREVNWYTHECWIQISYSSPKSVVPTGHDINGYLWHLQMMRDG